MHLICVHSQCFILIYPKNCNMIDINILITEKDEEKIN